MQNLDPDRHRRRAELRQATQPSRTVAAERPGSPEARLTGRYITAYGVIMGLSNAERQCRFRERRKEQLPRIHYRRPQRWRDAVQTLVDLQAEYQDWLDNLPDGLQATPPCRAPGGDLRT